MSSIGKIGIHMVCCGSKFGALIRASRIKLGLSQARVAKRLGVTRACFSGYERGKHCPGRKLHRLAKTLKLDPVKLQSLRPGRRMKRLKSRTALAKFVIALRQERHFTQEEVARRAGLTSRTIAEIERGKNRHPTASLLGRISSALRSSIPADLE